MDAFHVTNGLLYLTFIVIIQLEKRDIFWDNGQEFMSTVWVV